MEADMTSSQDAQQRRRSRIKSWAYIVTAAFTLLLCVFLLFIQDTLHETENTKYSDTKTLKERNVYPNGIFIDSVPIGLMTYDEAYEAVVANLTTRSRLWSVTLRYGQEAYQVHVTADMVTTDLEDVLHQAMTVGENLSDAEYQAYIARLPYYPIQFTLDIDIDPSPVEEEVRARAEALSVPAEDAYLLSFDPEKPEYQRFTYQKEVYGTYVDADWLWEAVRKELIHREDGIVEIKAKTLIPKVHVTDLQRSNALASTFSTKLPEDEGILSNLELLCSRLSWRILQSQESFSWNQCFGVISEENGYIMDGNPDAAAYQAATTLMNSAMLAGFDITAHSPNPDLPNYVTQGRETRVGGEQDLVFLNTSGSYAILILTMDKDEGVLTAEIYGEPALEEYRVDIHTVVKEILPIPEETAYLSNEDVPQGETRNEEGKEGRLPQPYHLCFILLFHYSLLLA